jgi:hypothetical protein
LIDEAFSVAQEKLFAQKFFTNYDGRPTNQLEYLMKDCQHDWQAVTGQPIYKCAHCGMFMRVEK